MTLYVAEIGGRGIVAFEAPSEAAAQARLADKAFLRDLYVLQNEGRPLWDGSSAIVLREPLPKEAAAWQADHVPAESTDNDDEPEQGRVFLVPVVDPTSFADDDDDDHDHDRSD